MFRRLLAVLLTVVAVLAAGWLALRRPAIPFESLEAAYASADSHFLTLRTGEKIHYRDQGDADGPTLVLVHGFASSLHTWEPWVRRLGPDFRIISFDLPGHGLSRSMQPDDVSIGAFVNSVNDVADALDLDRFTLVGHSMGGNTAWNYALEHGARLDGLVLISASGWPKDTGGADDRPLVFKLMDNPVARRAMRDLDLSNLVESGLRKSVADPAVVTDEMVARYAALSRAPGHRDALLALAVGREGRGGASAEAMALIATPTLVIHGRQDSVVPFEGGVRFAETISGAAFLALDEVGHMPQEEAVAETATRLREFMVETAARRAVLDEQHVALDAGSAEGVQP